MEVLSAQHVGKVYALGGGVPALWLLRRQRGRSARALREVHALSDVSFSVAAGTVLGIIGPNGAGKTTLLKIIGRITPPSSGRIVGRGRVVSLLELGVGFQPWLSGHENVLLSSAIYGIPRAEAERRVTAIAEFAELGDFFEVPVSRYSSGMYLRLAFSMAVHMDPDILLADEVLAVGDAAFQRRCLERVSEERARGRTVLFVSHDLATVTRICNEVIWLRAGRVHEQGDPAEVVGRYQSDSWADSSAAPVEGSLARIVGVELRSSGGTSVGSVKISEAFSIAVTFDVLVAGARVWPRFSLTCSGVQVFGSAPAEPLPAAEPGRYLARARIPGGLLTDTAYAVDVSLPVVGADSQEVLHHSRSLVFRVYSDPGQPFKPEEKNVIALARGVIAPRLEWDWVPAPTGSVVATGSEPS